MERGVGRFSFNFNHLKDSKKHKQTSVVQSSRQNAQYLLPWLLVSCLGIAISCQHFPTLSQSARFHQVPVRMQRINT